MYGRGGRGGYYDRGGGGGGGRGRWGGSSEDYRGNRGTRDFSKRGSYGGSRGDYRGNRDDYGGNRGEYGGSQGDYGGSRGDYGGNRDDYGGNRGSYGGSSGEYSGGRSDWGRGRGRGGGGGGRGRGRGGERPPPGLKGREIGLWYAKRNKERAAKDETKFPVVSMDAGQVQHVGRLLDSLEDTSALDRPSRSYPQYQESTNRREDTRDDRASGSGARVIDSFSDPDAWIEENTQKRKMPTDIDQKKKPCADSFSERLSTIKDSDFKQAYVANVRANKMRDADGMLALAKGKVGLVRQESLDERYYEELMEQQNDPQYQKMLDFRKNLPAYKMRDDIVDAVRNNQVVVISGETGCGKTTQVAQFLLEDAIADGRGSVCRVVCTQPRRISAISVAQRVAAERAERLGKSVGYQIRLESVQARQQGSIQFCTTGIVLQWLQGDPLLSNVSHLVLDEVHERDMLSDFLMAVAKDLITVRSDLKLILMSATLNAEQFSEYYGGCPMLHIPGFTFPVKEFYLEDVLDITKFRFTEERKPYQRRINMAEQKSFEEMIYPYVKKLEVEGKYSSHTLDEIFKVKSEELNLNLIHELLRHISQQEPGAVLVFLPGWMEITKLHNLIQEDRMLSGRNNLVIPLHSLMPTVNQQEVFDRPPPGVRKIILATNIAETSITIDDIVYVIDAGRIKMKNYDKVSNVETLLPEWVTLANARQRRGRAGRVQEGVCYHLYTRARERVLAEYPLPEIQRSRLEEIILHVKIMRLGSVRPFLGKVMMPPDDDVVLKSLELLQAINALDESENLTPLGFHLARMPVDPLTGRMLLMAAIFSCVDPILTIASALSFKDPFVIPMGKEKQVDEIKRRLADKLQSDHLLCAKVYREWEEACYDREDRHYCSMNFLSGSVLHQMKNMRRQFMGLLHEHKFVRSKDPKAAEANRNSDNTPLVLAVITSGLYPNVARIIPPRSGHYKKHKPLNIRSQYDHRVYLHPKSVNEKDRYFPTQWMVYREKVKSSRVYIHDSSMVSNYPLLLFGQKVEYHNGLINVDGFVRLRCSEQVAQLVKSLRVQLDELLEYKISHPGITTWNKSTKEGALLNAIVDLLSSEKVVDVRDMADGAYDYGPDNAYDDEDDGNDSSSDRDFY